MVINGVRRDGPDSRCVLGILRGSSPWPNQNIRRLHNSDIPEETGFASLSHLSMTKRHKSEKYFILEKIVSDPRLDR